MLKVAGYKNELIAFQPHRKPEKDKNS